MSKRDDYYGSPTHSCKFCAKTFPAEWLPGAPTPNDRILIVDLLCTGDEALYAEEQGCEFFAYDHFLYDDDSSLFLKLERDVSGSTSKVEPYLTAKLSCISPMKCDEPLGVRPARIDVSGILDGRSRDNLLVVRDGKGNKRFIAYPESGRLLAEEWFGSTRPPNLNPMSDNAVKLARSWVGSYALGNDSNREEWGKTRISPKRLLEIDASDSVIRLINTREEESYEYLALSYCWGGPQKVMTTTFTFASHHEGIPIESLGKSIRDAVQVAIQLGLRYAWVDAICIVQDDPLDVALGIADQARVYQNAQLTIVAGDALSSEDGFLHRRELKSFRYRIKIEYEDKEESILVDRRLAFGDEYDAYRFRDIVDSRAWIYQEVILSPRLLYFSPHQMLFYSNGEVRTDGGIPEHSLFQPKMVSPGEHSVTDILERWHIMVRKYSGMAMSKYYDKLPAISAIAELISKELSDAQGFQPVYLAGLWKQCMPIHLIWRKAGSADFLPRPEYRAPTWSWASLNSQTLILSVSKVAPDSIKARLVDFDIQLSSTHVPFGEVTGGYIELEAPVKEIPYFKITMRRIYLLDLDFQMIWKTPTDAVESDEILDIKSGQGHTIFLLSLVEETLHHMFHKMGIVPGSAQHYCLVLLKRKGEHACTRLGLFNEMVLEHTPDEEVGSVFRWQHSFRRKTIRIV